LGAAGVTVVSDMVFSFRYGLLGRFIYFI
jgi:hypothetical protein